MEITYVYDQKFETYFRIVDENITKYTVVDYAGDLHEITKYGRPLLKTLQVGNVGDRIYHTRYKEYGTVAKVDINDHEQTYRITWDKSDKTLNDWPDTEHVVVIDY